MKKYLLLIMAIALGVWACSKGGDGGKEDPSKPSDPTDYINTFYPNEVKPSSYSPCFAGAYYRKVMSSSDVWTGIEGTVVLPTITFDPNRVNPAKPKQYLDNPSIYLGGNMGGQETDIGMTWEVIKDAQGNVSQDRVAFRPFMRKSGITGDAALYSNAPAEARYYWYQGEEVTMSIRIEKNGYLKFVVEGAGKRYETSFQCAGYSRGAKGQFKRVNAIDQVSNEGKPAQPTKTVVSGGEWKNTYLYRLVNGTDVKVPMHSNRMTDMRCPDTRYFIISSTNDQKKLGAETITIDGGK